MNVEPCWGEKGLVCWVNKRRSLMYQAGDTLLLLSKYYLASPTDSLWCSVLKQTADRPAGISQETARKKELGLFHAPSLLTEVWDNTVSLAFGISVSAVSEEGATLLPSYTLFQRLKCYLSKVCLSMIWHTTTELFMWNVHIIGNVDLDI